MRPLLSLLLLLSKAAAGLFLDTPHFIEVEEDTARIIRPAIEVVDKDDAGADAELWIGCTGGVVSLPPSPKISVSLSDESHALQANGTIDALNAALTQATYTPAQDNVVSWSRSEQGNPNLQVCTVFVKTSTNDGLQRTEESFFVDVLPTNDPPTIIVPGVVHRALQDSGGYAIERIDNLVVEEDEPLSIDVIISDVDIAPHDPSDTSLFTVDLMPSHGSSVALRETAGLYFSHGSDSTRFRGTLSSINKALRGLRFVGAKDYHGNATLTVQVWDEGNIGRGGELSERVALPISILSVDDPPAFTLSLNFVVCGEESLCTITGVQVQDPDASSDSFVRIEATVELGRLDLMRTGVPPSILVDKSDDHSLVVEGTFADVNKMLASLSYHGIAGTHSRVDTVRLHFFEVDNSNYGTQKTNSVPAASATITVLITDTANNRPAIEYDGAIYRDDASCSANTDPPPKNLSIVSANASSPFIDEGVCNRLVRTEPFVCTEDKMCQLSGMSMVDADSNVLQVHLTVSLGILDIPEGSRIGLQMNSGFSSASSYTIDLRGTREYINKALSDLTYKANRHYNGIDSLVVTVSGGNDASSSGDSMVIPINITTVDDLPKVVGPDDVLQVSEDGFVALGVLLEDVDSSASGPMVIEISAKHGAFGLDDSSQEDVLLVEVTGTLVERDTATPHRWYSTAEVRGETTDLNRVVASIVFSPQPNFNSEAGGYASVSVALSSSNSYRIDSAEYLIRVSSVNDAPLASISPASVLPGGNDTAVSILEDTYLSLKASVSDVDDKTLTANLTSTNGSMRVFKRTRTCFSCNDLDDVLIDTAEDGRTIKMEGTIDSLNSKLGDIRFVPDEDFSSEASVRITVSDDDGAMNIAEQLITVIPNTDSFELWMPASASSGFVPEVEISEGEMVLIGATWYHPRFVLGLHSLSQDTIDGRPRLISPFFHHQDLEEPQAFAVVDKEEAASPFCAEVRVGIGSISLHNNNSSATFEAEASSDNKALKFVGTVDEVNAIARQIMFSADTEESGHTFLTTTICEGVCGWANIRPPSRGCVEGKIKIYVEPLNNPPIIIVKSEQDQPVKIALNSEEVSIASIAIADSDLQDDVIIDPFQRENSGSLTVVLRASAGTVSLKSLDGLTFLRGTGLSSPLVVFMGQLHDVNHALSSLYFTCFEGLYGCAEGKASIEIIVNDNGYTGKGLPLSAETAIDLIVVAAEDT